MRKELVFALGLTIATVGGACKREPQQQPPPTPTASSGEPRPSSLEAEIQARVRATVTAQRETPPTSEKILFTSTDPKLPFQVKYDPSYWTIGKDLNFNSKEQSTPSCRGQCAPAAVANFRVIAEPPHQSSTVDEFVNSLSVLNTLKKWGIQYQREKRLISGREAITLKYHAPPVEGAKENSFSKWGIFFDSTRRIWLTALTVFQENPQVEARAVPRFDEMLDSFKILEGPAGQQAARPAEAQKPPSQIEAPKTMTLEQQAKTAALGSTLNLLGNPQVSQNQQRLDSNLLTPITAFPFSKIVEDQIIPPDADLVRVRWVFTTPGFRGMTKVFGQGEIKNFKLKTANILPVTPADRANGIQWKGNIEIGLVYKYRAVKPWFLAEHGAFKSGGRDNEWAKATIPAPTIPFTPWIDGKLTIPVFIINDEWRPQREGEIEYPILPALYMNDEGGCRPDGRSPIPGCEVVRLKWEEN